MKKCVIVFLICLAASNAFAESQPFQASLLPDVAIHSKTTRIEGVTLNIWGENPQTAFALGIVNGSTGKSAGLSWSIVNYAENYTGVEWAVVNYATKTFKGWQHGLLNYSGDFTGLQLGTVNIARGTDVGVQVGLFNYTEKLKGLQFGTINYAGTADSGLQIGLVNIIKQNKWFTGFPDELATGMIFVNWRF